MHSRLAACLAAAAFAFGLSIPPMNANAQAPSVVGAQLSAKKSTKGTLQITVTGSGTYTVSGKNFKKSGSSSKKFNVKPGTYRVAAPGGTVQPAKTRVRKGKTAKVAIAFSSPTPSANIKRVSTSANGGQGDEGSQWPQWSPDGKKIVFSSNATNLVSGDTNGQQDLFVKTLATGAIQRVSTSANGAQADGASYQAVWSPDGTKIAFSSRATNLVTGDTNKLPDVFVKTLATGTVEIVSNSPFELWDMASRGCASDACAGRPTVSGSPSLGGFLGSAHPAWSPDGSKVAFDSDATNLVIGDGNGRTDVFVKTLGNNTVGSVQRVSTDANGTQGNAASYHAAWSPDGSKIAFDSFASNLVSGDTNGRYDVFVKTLTSKAIQRVSTDASGGQATGPQDAGSTGPLWSPDGTRIMFTSDMTNLVPGDTNNVEDVFVKTLATKAIQRVSTSASGAQAAQPGGSDNPQWASDGKRIVFSSSATNLVAGDTNGRYDVFVKTLASGAIQRVSTNASGKQSSGGHRGSDSPAWSRDGKIAFDSDATNLVSGDTNGRYDVFVKTLS